MEKESSAYGIYQNNQFFPSLAPFSFDKKEISHLTLKDQLLFEQYGSGIKLATPFLNVLDAFEHWLELMPNAIAAEHLTEKITYKQLDDKATILALILKQKGVKPGDKVGLYVSRSISMLVGIIATLKLGASYIPQDARIVPKKMLGQINEVCNLKIILSLAPYEQNIPSFNGEEVIFIDKELENPIYKNLYGDIKLIRHKNTVENPICFILFTSGTTGTPNGVKVTHKNLCNILYNPSGNLGIHPGTKVSQILNISFDMSAWEILGCLGNGGTLLIRDKSISETAQKANVIIATPSILTTINPDECKHVTSVAVAGEPCPTVLAHKWSQICDFYNCCGPTETTIVNTMKKCDPNITELSIGKPTPNNTVYILDEHKKPLPIGEVGIMWGGGDCVTEGYINNNLLNDTRYAYDPFINDGSKMFNTGDLGKWNEEGELVHFGRVDDQVKIKGFRVELDAISKIIERFAEVKRAVTIKHENILVAFLGAMTTINEINLAAIKKAIEEELPYYYLPSEFILVDELPKTPRGKIDKRKLRDSIKHL
ncbi:AMP-binding protein [Tenacibaculum maritimum]|uniref:AMP-binding protein n=1 Tax=Tenacibaculum maritimum TaxID=107401 RepID=UPI0003F78D5D|nr:AMP-binding protein [Tenacibaculum maritimum]MCD9563766.1 AMP-binding protein [Tenacibaculum maritimum]MCD9566864.1 AMP-binding protein [Tenacibaculum maritimum]MCD9580113.1 AMP-binding protein [Tenacibaculum maritimum]MCD9597705.1 AMP-binding protein [Tenacibaculum maritimum]MCD9611815.1 AMP-binding protein [Tenacibaculum maritimum]